MSRSLAEYATGDGVWVNCPYLGYPFPGVVRRKGGYIWVHINLYGEGSVKWCTHREGDPEDAGLRDRLLESIVGRTEDGKHKDMDGAGL